MANSTAMCTSFKKELMTATHDFTASTGDTFKAALFTSSASLGAATTAYGTTNEVSGTGYSAGGVSLTSVTPTTSGTTAFGDFADASWSSASFTGNALLIYNSSKSNKAVSAHAFGSDQTVSSGTLTIVFPTADATNAILRIG